MTATASPNELQYFIELSQTLNFSRAAERIGISQPSLSVAIKRLEDSIGVALFIRNKNGLVLTQAGKRLLVHSKKLTQLWDTVKSECLASHHKVQGNIKFGCHHSVALYALPKFMPDMLIKYPALDIQLKHDLSRKILESIINLSIDIGVVVNPVKHPDLILNKLYNDKVSFYCSASTKNVKALKKSENTIIACDPNLIQCQVMIKKLPKNYRLFETSNLELIANMASENGFIGILPASVAEFLPKQNLKIVDEMPFYEDEIYLAYRHENRDIKAINEMVKAIKSSLQK